MLVFMMARMQQPFLQKLCDLLFKTNNSSFKRVVLGLGKENQIEVKGILDDKDYASKVCLDIE